MSNRRSESRLKERRRPGGMETATKVKLSRALNCLFLMTYCRAGKRKDFCAPDLRFKLSPRVWDQPRARGASQFLAMHRESGGIGPRSVPLRRVSTATSSRGRFCRGLACLTAVAWDKPRSACEKLRCDPSTACNRLAPLRGRH